MSESIADLYKRDKKEQAMQDEIDRLAQQLEAVEREREMDANKIAAAVFESVAQTIEESGPLSAEDVRGAIPILAMRLASEHLKQQEETTHE